jgi:hypothetical protein
MVEGFSYNAWVGDYGGITIGFVVVDRLAKSYSSSRLKIGNNKRKNKYGSSKWLTNEQV